MRYNKFNVAPKEERTYNDIVFSSKMEMKRYMQLMDLLLAGHIDNLLLQVPFETIPKSEWSKAEKYVADFVYYDVEKKKNVIEDVKGYRTRLFNKKWKIMQKRYGDEYILRVVDQV